MRLLIGLCLGGAVAHNLIRHFEEHFVNIATRLRRCLEEFEAVLLGQSCTTLSGDNSIGQVGFVGHEHFCNTDAGMGLNLLEPILDIVKGALLRTVVHQDDTHGPLVICLSDRAESFLTCCVPHLKLYSLVLHIDSLYLEVNP